MTWVKNSAPYDYKTTCHIPRLFMGKAVPDRVDSLEGRYDLFIVGYHDNRCLILLRHIIEDTDHRHGPLAVQRGSRLVSQDNRTMGNGYLRAMHLFCMVIRR